MTDLDTRPPAPPATPGPPAPAAPGPLGLRGWLRYPWTQLTSMRTALALLFALALAAIPGSLVPQRRVSPVAVSDFLTDHPRLGPLYDRVGLFEVYSSPWFSAIYLMLFLSLVGCIIPRLRVYARALRSQPPRTPRHLARLPAYASVSVPATDGVLERAAASLRRSRYRVRVEHGAVAAERGYLREAGNLVFHLSLLVLLLGVALGGLLGFRGTSVVVVGQGFSNTLTQYDDLSAGARFREADLAPFTIKVVDFDVKFETGNVQRGAARLFRAEVEVTDAPGAAPRRETLEVNHPISIEGTSVHLIGHGYAPRVTVRDANGQVAFSGPVVFLPQDGNFTSAGVIKAPDARPERLAFEGFFLPTAVLDSQGPRSVFPDAANPALFLNAWAGPPRVETGRPENVYSLDPAGLTPLTTANGEPVRMALQPGGVFTLPDGQGTIALEGWTRWVKLQIGDTPGVGLSLAAVGFGVTGLCLSLFVRPRRIWVRARRLEDGSTLVEVAGLDRADARTGLGGDVQQLATRITSERPTEADR
ncbi:MAG: cytochrome c biogenesis protein ResB [Actinomycetes bacterium]